METANFGAQPSIGLGNDFTPLIRIGTGDFKSASVAGACGSAINDRLPAVIDLSACEKLAGRTLPRVGLMPVGETCRVDELPAAVTMPCEAFQYKCCHEQEQRIQDCEPDLQTDAATHPPASCVSTSVNSPACSGIGL